MSINYNDSIYNGISFISSLILLLLYSLILILSKQKVDKITKLSFYPSHWFPEVNGIFFFVLLSKNAQYMIFFFL